MKIDNTIMGFDEFLAERGASFSCVAIGAAALGLLGIVSRHTRDLDILDPEIPEDILLFARDFAEKCREEGLPLSDDWINNGPISLREQLPGGWRGRLQPAFEGRALKIHCPGRTDLLCSKLFALCDRGVDLADCLALAPTDEEIEEITPWLEYQDTNPGWPDHVREVVNDLKERLEYGL